MIFVEFSIQKCFSANYDQMQIKADFLDYQNDF